MKQIISHYKKVNDWAILERKTFHSFGDDETTFEAVKVCIGEIEVLNVNLNNHYNKEILPIIRWISIRDYDYMRENEDMIVW